MDIITYALLKKKIEEGGGSGGKLPIASASILGGVKIGAGLTITEDGILNAVGITEAKAQEMINAAIGGALTKEY